MQVLCPARTRLPASIRAPSDDLGPFRVVLGLKLQFRLVIGLARQQGFRHQTKRHLPDPTGALEAEAHSEGKQVFAMS